jgi:hypothetical protein
MKSGQKFIPIKSWKQDLDNVFDDVVFTRISVPLQPGGLDYLQKKHNVYFEYNPEWIIISQEKEKRAKANNEWELCVISETLRRYALDELQNYKDGRQISQDIYIEKCLEIMVGYTKDSLYGPFWFDLYCLYRRLTGLKK